MMRHQFRRFLGWVYARLYDEFAAIYDPVSWLVSGGRWRQWQLTVLRYIHGQRVLEVGPGTGYLLAALRDAGYDAYAVERSPVMAQRSARRAGPGLVVQADARALPFATSSFDTVVATFPAPVVHDPAFGGEVARVLRPAGRLVLLLGAESGAYPWPGLLERLLGWTAGGDAVVCNRLDLFSGELLDLSTPDGRLSLFVATRPR